MGSGNSTINHPSMTILVVLERGARYTVFISSRQEPPGAGWLAEKKASLVSMRQQKKLGAYLVYYWRVGAIFTLDS